MSQNVTGLFLFFFLFACGEKETTVSTPFVDAPTLMVLGTAQDAGYPQVDCRKECCAIAWADPALRRHPTSLALFSPEENKTWLIECTPDVTDQWQMTRELAPDHELAGICLTHGHIGHYAGLMYLGREAMGTDMIPVHVMPRMKEFLQTHGPWEQLIRLDNIRLKSIRADSIFSLGNHFQLTPLQVPHRDEYTETVAYLIEGPQKKVLFLPDIDKWQRWSMDMDSLLTKVDMAFLDATFYSEDEVPGRDMSQIPHPSVNESMVRFDHLPDSIRARIHFIHLNHTNPLLNVNSPASETVRTRGYNIARQGQKMSM